MSAVSCALSTSRGGIYGKEEQQQKDDCHCPDHRLLLRGALLPRCNPVPVHADSPTGISMNAHVTAMRACQSSSLPETPDCQKSRTLPGAMELAGAANNLQGLEETQYPVGIVHFKVW